MSQPTPCYRTPCATLPVRLESSQVEPTPETNDARKHRDHLPAADGTSNLTTLRRLVLHLARPPVLRAAHIEETRNSRVGLTVNALQGQNKNASTLQRGVSTA